MTLYIKYKISIKYDLHSGFNLKIHIKMRTENEKYKLFANNFVEEYYYRSYKNAYEFIEGDGLKLLVVKLVEKYYENKRNDFEEDNAFHKLLDIKKNGWQEMKICLDVEDEDKSA